MKNKIYLILLMFLYLDIAYSQSITYCDSNGCLYGESTVGHIGDTLTFVSTYDPPLVPDENGFLGIGTVIYSGEYLDVVYLSSNRYESVLRVALLKAGNTNLRFKTNIGISIFDRSTHVLSGTYTSDGYTKKLSTDQNVVKRNSKVKILFYMPMKSFSYKQLGTTNGTVVSSGSNYFEFIPLANYVSFLFTFDWGCCTTTEHIEFNIISGYSVTSARGVVVIEKENSMYNELSADRDRYEIIDALTGLVRKNGILTSHYNTIDASSLSNGTYIVRIITDEGVTTDKISINN